MYTQINYNFPFFKTAYLSHFDSSLNFDAFLMQTLTREKTLWDFLLLVTAEGGREGGEKRQRKKNQSEKGGREK